MLKAKLFKDNVDTIVSAQEVKDGKYSRYDNFVDIKYEFRVQYVNGARNNGSPYFRFYLSREDYKRLSTYQKTKSEILKGLKHIQKSFWHNEWQEKVKSFCQIEKHIKDKNTGKWKFADAFYSEKNICIEFQHSFIDLDFEDRNEFYRKQGIKTVWLYDLSNSEVKKMEGNEGFEILEDNARGFFRIAETKENLKNNLVFVQVKNRNIYQVDELLRKEIDRKDGLKSTIRWFCPKRTYTEEEFIKAIKIDDFDNGIDSIINLWNKANPTRYAIFQNVESGRYIGINRNPSEQRTIRGYISSSQSGLFGNPLSEIYYPYDKCFKLIKKV